MVRRLTRAVVLHVLHVGGRAFVAPRVVHLGRARLNEAKQHHGAEVNHARRMNVVNLS